MEDKDKYMYAHSGCCNAHWEMVYDKEAKEFFVCCEKCGRRDNTFEIKGPVFEHPPECDCCKKEREIDEAVDDFINDDEV